MAAADDDFDVLNESVDVVEGTWRRMFEVRPSPTHSLSRPLSVLI